MQGILGQDRGGDPNGRLEKIFGVGPEGLPQWVFGSSVTCPDNGLEKIRRGPGGENWREDGQIHKPRILP